MHASSVCGSCPVYLPAIATATDPMIGTMALCVTRANLHRYQCYVRFRVINHFNCRCR